MEITFGNAELASLYEGKKPFKKYLKSNPSLVKQFIKTIKKLQSANKIEQLHQYKGLHYEKLKGNRKGQSSVRINQQYRLLFYEVESNEEPSRVIALEIQEISKHYE